jgi:hypothetical protein
MSDPKEQIKIRNIQLDNIFDEVNELKGIFKDAWEASDVFLIVTLFCSII